MCLLPFDRRRRICTTGESRLRLCVLFLAALASACGKPFNVKPATALPRAEYNATALVEHVSIRAEAIADEDLLYETFDANLILAGVLPVRVMITNSGEESVSLRQAKFVVRAEQGRSYKSVNPEQAFNRVMSYYQISTYSKSGYKESLSEFSAYGLDAESPLARGQSREGLVFFLVPEDVARGPGLILEISKLKSKQPPVLLKLS
jgi:hypothetical protein